MRIGSVGAPQQAQQSYSRASATPQDFGAGVASALTSLASSTQDFARTSIALSEEYKLRQRQQKQQGYDVEFLRKQGEWTRGLEESRRDAPIGADGFTNQIHDGLRKETEGFLNSIDDPELRARYAERSEAFLQNATTAAFSFEFEESNRAFGVQLEEAVSDAQTRIRQDPESLELELTQFMSTLDGSTFTDQQKDALETQIYNTLVGTRYQMEIELAQQGLVPARTADGSDIVAPGTPGYVRGMLNAIASVEANSYDVLNGGELFSGYVDHPRRIGKGGTSTAAGRYQFIVGTWDFVVRNMKAEGYDFGPEEFSPVNQDRAAWWYANHKYNSYARANGFAPELRDLTQVLKSGDRATIATARRVLAGVGNATSWQGFQTMSDDAFNNIVLGAQGIAGGPTGNSQLPDLWSDPRYGGLPFDTKMELEAAGNKAAADLRKAQADQRNEQVAETYNQIRRLAEDGDPMALPAVQAALASDVNFSNEQREDLRKRVADLQEIADNSADVAAGMASGSTFTREDDPAISDYLKSTGVTAGLRNEDPEAGQKLLLDAEKLGRVPSEVLDIFITQATSGNANTSQFGMQQLAALFEANPNRFAATATEDQMRDALQISDLMQSSASPAEAAQRFRESKDPRTAGERKILEEAAKPLSLELTPDDMLKGVAGIFARSAALAGVMGTDPTTLPRQINESLLFQSDFRRHYIDGFVRSGGDAEAALEYAGEMAQYSWSPDPINGSLMKYSPSSAGAGVPTLGGNFNWIERHTRETLGIEEGVPMALSADSITREQIAAGQPPSYTVLTTVVDDVSGIPTFTVMTKEDGTPSRVTMTPTQGMLDEITLQAEITNLEEKRERLIDRKTGIGFERATDPDARLGIQRKVWSPENQAELDRVTGQLNSLLGTEEVLAPVPEIGETVVEEAVQVAPAVSRQEQSKAYLAEIGEIQKTPSSQRTPEQVARRQELLKFFEGE